MVFFFIKRFHNVLKHSFNDVIEKCLLDIKKRDYSDVIKIDFLCLQKNDGIEICFYDIMEIICTR